MHTTSLQMDVRIRRNPDGTVDAVDFYAPAYNQGAVMNPIDTIDDLASLLLHMVGRPSVPPVGGGIIRTGLIRPDQYAEYVVDDKQPEDGIVRLPSACYWCGYPQGHAPSCVEGPRS